MASVAPAPEAAAAEAKDGESSPRRVHRLAPLGAEEKEAAAGAAGASSAAEEGEHSGVPVKGAGAEKQRGHGHGAEKPAAAATAGEPAEVPPAMKWLEVEEKSWGCLGKSNPVRNAALILTRSSLFDSFMLLNIVANFVILAAYDPTWSGPQTLQDKIQTALEGWFQGIFTFEMVVKLIALGPEGKHGYISDGWCVFDFLVVVLCYLNYIPNTGNATALRALRALRPLRSFGLVPALRRTFNGIMAVAAHEFRVEIIDWFLMFVFALCGVQLWSGIMSGGCFFPNPGYVAGQQLPAPVTLGISSNTALISSGTDLTVVPGFIRNRFINSYFYNADHAYGHCALPASTFGRAAPAAFGFAPPPATCPEAWFPSDPSLGGRASLQQQVCLEFQNPMAWTQKQGGMSFDNVGIGFLTTLVAETEEGWSNVNYALWHAWGVNWFVSLFLIGLIFGVDDFVAVMTDAASWSAYTEAQKREAAMLAADIEPERLAHLRRLERAALDEMWGSWAPKDPVGDARRAAQRGRDLSARLAKGCDACYTALPGVPQGCKDVFLRVEAVPGFDLFFVTLVIANIVSLACSYNGASDAYVRNLELSNYVFVALFVVELIVRLSARGARSLFSDPFNVFDFLIILASVADIIVSNLNPDGGGNGLSALRTLRVFRAFKLARSWKQLNMLLGTLWRAVPPVASIFTILFVLMLVFSAIGMQIFGGLYADAIAMGQIDEYPRHNYDHFGWAMVSSFHIIEGENWFIPLYQHMAILGPAAALFFVALNMVGAVTFSLVVAVFMQGFDEEEEEAELHELDQQLEEATRNYEKHKSEGTIAAAAAAAEGGGSGAREGTASFTFAPSTHRVTKLVVTLPPRGLAPPQGLADAGAEETHFDGRSIAMRVIFTETSQHVVGLDTKTGREIDPTRLANVATGFEASTLEGAPEDDKALYCLGPKNATRVWLAGVISSRSFEFISLVITLLSCVNLALDEPWLETCDVRNPSTCSSSQKPLATYLFGCDAAVVAWFTLEALLKIGAQGFMGQAHSYVRSWWNLTDLFIVVTSIAGLAVAPGSGPGLELSAIRSVRAVRSLRVLRLLRQFSLLSRMTDVVVSMLPGMANASVLVFLFIYIFAIIGMQSFQGTLNICNDFSVSTKDQCQGFFKLAGPNCAMLPTWFQERDCKSMGNQSTYMFPRRFEQQLPNWDNFGNALLQTYMIADGENWPDMMYNTVDGGTNVDDPMTRDNNQWKAVFFILCIIVLDCVVIDLFTGVVRETYKHIRERSGGRSYLTHGQRKMVDNIVLVLETKQNTPVKPPADKDSLAFAVYSLVYLPAFESVVMVLIVMSTLVVAMHRYPNDADTVSRLNTLHYFFTCAFGLEMLMRIFCSGVSGYLLDPWNAFDGAMTLTSGVGMGLTLATEAGLGMYEFGVMRLTLGLRILRLFNYVRSLRHDVPFFHHCHPVIKAIYKAAPRVLQVVLFFSVLVYMFAVVGMAAFGRVRHGYAGDMKGGNPATSNGNLGVDANFESFPVAMYTLYRAFTGENWNSLLLDLMVQAPYCNPASDDTGTCGQPIFSPIYWIAYMIMSDMVVDNLMTAIVLEAFWHEMEPSEVFVAWKDGLGRKLYNFSHHASEQFIEAWATVDPFGDAPGATREQLIAVVQLVDAPLGVRPPGGGAHGHHAAGGDGHGLGHDIAAAAAAKVDSLRLGGGIAAVPFHVALHALVLRASVGHEETLGAGKLRLRRKDIDSNAAVDEFRADEWVDDDGDAVALAGGSASVLSTVLSGHEVAPAPRGGAAPSAAAAAAAERGAAAARAAAAASAQMGVIVTALETAKEAAAEARSSAAAVAALAADIKAGRAEELALLRELLAVRGGGPSSA